jgi:hypothetical protein
MISYRMGNARRLGKPDVEAEVDSRELVNSGLNMPHILDKLRVSLDS